MKAKKAVKRLDKVVAMLSDIIKRYSPTERNVKELLGAAKASVVRVKAAVGSSASPRAATKARGTVNKAKPNRVTAAVRKASTPAKRRRAPVKPPVSARTAARAPEAVTKTKPERFMTAAAGRLAAPAKKRRAATKSQGVPAPLPGSTVSPGAKTLGATGAPTL